MTDQPAKARRRYEPATEAEPADLLIVDDHPIVRRGLVELINHEKDLNVCADVSGAHEALDVLKQHIPHMCIIDLTLEGIGGLDLIKQVKSLYKDLPMLVLSMHDESVYAERALRGGAKGYIMKQAGADNLLVAIRKVLRGEVYVSDAMASRMLGAYVGDKGTTDKSPIDRLSDRELEVFELIGQGLGSRQIAEKLCVSIKTIESHREHIKEKLNLKNAAELVQRAVQWGQSQGTT